MAGVHAGRRRRLGALLKPGDLAVLATGPQRRVPGADSADPWPDFHYLTGLDHADCGLMLERPLEGEGLREWLFVPEAGGEVAWDAPVGASAVAAAGVSEVRRFREFEVMLRARAFGAARVFVFGGGNPFAPGSEERWLVDLCRRLLPAHRTERLAPLLGAVRAVKSAIDLDGVRAAAITAAAGLRRAAGAIRPGVRGCELKAEYLHAVHRRSSRGPGCPILTAAGRETLTLHWLGDARPAEAGEVLLMDVTAEQGRWHADLTRCFPVDGRFRGRQREIHDAVRRALAFAIGTLRPGRRLADCHEATECFLQDELLRLGLLTAGEVSGGGRIAPGVLGFCPHRIFHHVGMEVHDPVPDSCPLEVGAVLAVEPGIFCAAAGFGIRLEETVALTVEGPEVLTSGMPVDADEIEALLGV